MRSRLPRRLAALAIALCGLVLPPAAQGASGGAGVAPAPAPRPASGPAPVLLDARCTSNPGRPCVEAHRAEEGAALRLIGRYLTGTSLIVFYGAPGSSDDVTGPAAAVSDRRATTTVPAGARTGPIGLVNLAGRRSRRWSGLLVEGSQPAFGVSSRPAGALDPVQVAVSQPRRLFFGGPQKAVFAYRSLGQRPVDLRVNLVRVTDNAVVRAWERPAVEPGAVNRVLWNGGLRGGSPRAGRYAFVLSTGGAAAAVRAATPAPAESITVYDHIFPVRGKHDFGGAGAHFGAGRSGRSHQGQDVFAACGTPLVAARGGTVQFAGYHAAAGHYVVIDGQSTGVDYAYMHLRQPAEVRVGDRVFTGQSLGEVGDSGNAHGCHLHFEEWTAPGWYDGGRPYDPLPDLRRWDRTS